MDARLAPPHFLAMKATLMREAERLGGPPPRERVCSCALHKLAAGVLP